MAVNIDSREPHPEAPASSFVEQRAIEYIPLSERHGRPNTLFTIWFASNAQITASPRACWRRRSSV